MKRLFFTALLSITGCVILHATEPQDTTNIYKADSLAAEMFKADSLAEQMLEADTIISNKVI